MEIRKYPDPILKKKALSVKEVSPAVFELLRQMKEMLGKEQRGVKGVGLAAPQVGVSQRVIVIGFEKGTEGFINPKVVKKSWQKEEDKEGCLSLPGVWLQINRPKRATIQALDERGQPVCFETEGFVSRVFQHEIDHLDGILFFERLGLLQKLKAKRKINSLFKK